MKQLMLLLIAIISLQAHKIIIEKAKLQRFGKQLITNAKIVQLSNQQQLIVSRLGGHLEAYYVKPGEIVKKGDPIAKIKSLELSKMTSNYIALGKKIDAARERFSSIKKLFEKGLISKQDLNKERITLASIEADRNTLASQLKSLGIDLNRLKSATDILIVYAHADGLVSRLLAPLHANLNAQTPIVSLVQKSGYYAIAYISVKEALNLPKDIQGRLYIGNLSFDCQYMHLLPKVDEETQRAQILFWIKSSDKPILLNAFAKMEISLPPYKKYVAIKSSALTMFKGEWVVFVPKKEEEHEEHNEKEEHQHEEIQYEIRVVDIIERFGEKVAVKGIEDGEEYVADGVYFVKSDLLKSEIGEHGH
ncbi:MAG TPA: hypothetical protein EYP79_01300 [Campylobacterales bacterium]|nr:hypothetical protein [Campylobacterales bacterium]